MIQYQTEIALKSLNFIDDKDLQVVLEKRLDELERVFAVNANLSTIILSISCIEGIFKHIADIFRELIKTSPDYPLKSNGGKKDFHRLTIEELYKLFLERNIMQRIENFDQIYSLFRNYRNFIHPQKQKKESWPVGLGQAQMAIGLLNATIEQLSNSIFIGAEILETISGHPRLDLSKVLHFDLANTRTHSFSVLKRNIDSKLEIEFEIDLDEGGLLNFVFNYLDDSSFKMLRLDNRESTRTPNALLYSKQRYHWNVVGEAEEKKPPQGVFGVSIYIDFNEQKFTFSINGKPYKFFKTNNKEINLFSELKKGLRVGWFNELRPVKMYKIKIT